MTVTNVLFVRVTEMTTQRTIELLQEVIECPRLTTEQCMAVAKAIDMFKPKVYVSRKKEKCTCGARPQLWCGPSGNGFNYGVRCPECGKQATGNTEVKASQN